MPGAFATASSEYIAIPDLPSLDVGSADFCAMCWFRAGGNNQGIFSKGTDVPTGFPGWFARVGGPSILIVGFNDGTGGFDIVDSFPTTMTDNVWRHLAIVRDGGAGLYRLYVDGVEIDTTAISNASGSLDNSVDMLIGALHNSGGSPSQFLDGAVDDARFYKFAPSADLIKEIYDAGGADETIPQPDGHWRLDEFAPGASMSGADTIQDLSGNDNHGTPVNTPTGAEGILNFEQIVE